MDTIFKIIMALIKGMLFLLGLLLIFGGGSCVIIMIPGLAQSHGANNIGNGVLMLSIALAVAITGFIIVRSLSKNNTPAKQPQLNTSGNSQEAKTVFPQYERAKGEKNEG